MGWLFRSFRRPVPRRVFGALEIVVVTALVLSTLDLLAMADPELERQTFPRPSPTETRVQQALLWPLGAWALLRGGPLLWPRVRELPMPVAPLVVCGGIWLIEVGHFAQRTERFPFSHVGMFSHLAWAGDDFVAPDQYVIEHHDGVEVVSMLREGDPLFQQYLDMSAHESWVLLAHRRAPKVKDRLREEFTRRGLPPPKLAKVRFRTRDGHVLAIVKEAP